MSLNTLFLNNEFIDCHVHATHRDYGSSIVFTNLPINEIICKQYHIVRLESVINGKHKYICSTCNKTVYYGDDPFVRYNDELIKQMQGNELVFPFIPISPYSLEQIEYYEHAYPGLIYGYKLHPNYSNYNIDQFKPRQDRIYIVHSGVGEKENPLKIIDFAKNLDGIVIIAHLGRFCKQAYDLARTMDNVYFDCSPLFLLWKSYIAHSDRLFDSSFLGTFSTPSDMIERVADYIGVDKLVYGSDAPFGDYSFDMDCCRALDISLRDQICSKNIVKLLKSINNVQSAEKSTI